MSPKTLQYELYPSPLRRAVAVGAMSAVGLTGVGVAVGAWEDLDARQRYDEVSEDLAVSQADLSAAQASEDRIYVKLGEACTTLIGQYVDGPLADVDEDGAVMDLRGTTGTPCGNEPAVVRNNLQDVRDAHTLITDTEANIRVAQEDLAGKQSDVAQHGANFFGLLGSLAGLGSGSFIGKYGTKFYKNRNIEFSNATYSGYLHHARVWKAKPYKLRRILVGAFTPQGMRHRLEKAMPKGKI